VRPRALNSSGPIRHVGQDEVRAATENLTAALAGVTAEEALITASSPSNLEL
jgi:hypothetical protein